MILNVYIGSVYILALIAAREATYTVRRLSYKEVSHIGYSLLRPNQGAYNFCFCFIKILNIFTDTEEGGCIVKHLIPLIKFLSENIPLTLKSFISASRAQQIKCSTDIYCSDLETMTKVLNTLDTKYAYNAFPLSYTNNYII